MIRSLQKRNQDGNLYKRPPAVEATIKLAIQKDPDTLRRQPCVSNPSSPDFLPLECLVYVIRDASTAASWNGSWYPSWSGLRPESGAA
jgi:hypothetical protein